MFVTMIFLLDDDRAFAKFKAKCKLLTPWWNHDGLFSVREANTAKQLPSGVDVSVFYVMHYMRGIIKAKKHN